MFSEPDSELVLVLVLLVLSVLSYQIHKLGYLLTIAKLLKHPDREVVQQTAVLVNNLALNETNQTVLKVRNPSTNFSYIY